MHARVPVTIPAPCRLASQDASESAALEESSGVSVLLGRRRRELGEEVDGRAALAEHLEELGLEVVLVRLRQVDLDAADKDELPAAELGVDDAQQLLLDAVVRDVGRRLDRLVARLAVLRLRPCRAEGGERWVRRRWAVRRALAVSETRLRTASAG